MKKVEKNGQWDRRGYEGVEDNERKLGGKKEKIKRWIKE